MTTDDSVPSESFCKKLVYRVPNEVLIQETKKIAIEKNLELSDQDIRSYAETYRFINSAKEDGAQPDFEKEFHKQHPDLSWQAALVISGALFENTLAIEEKEVLGNPTQKLDQLNVEYKALLLKVTQEIIDDANRKGMGGDLQFPDINKSAKNMSMLEYSKMAFVIGKAFNRTLPYEERKKYAISEQAIESRRAEIIKEMKNARQCSSISTSLIVAYGESLEANAFYRPILRLKEDGHVEEIL
ncbi:hypothetical protein [Collimonas arenae]|uniref:hypothetical protein n=1 Tax=Collimonas arenae TaxID=279058 RepID=UPI00155A79E4|nr:hypothetical protein [Collimonas arenae]